MLALDFAVPEVIVDFFEFTAGHYARMEMRTEGDKRIAYLSLNPLKGSGTIFSKLLWLGYCHTFLKQSIANLG